MTTSRKGSTFKSKEMHTTSDVPLANGAGLPDASASPVEIHFHGLEKSDAIIAKIEGKVAKLRRHFGRLTACRVVLDAPNRGAEKLKTLKVKIELSLPKRRPLVIEHERTVAHAHNDLNLALRDAFEIATRRIDDVAERIGARVRQERGRRRPAPVIA